MNYEDIKNLENEDIFWDKVDDIRIAKSAIFKIPRNTFFGKHVAVDYGVYVTTQLLVADYVHIGAYTTIIGGKEAECIFDDFSWTSAGVRIVCGGETPEALINPTIPKKYREILYDKVEFFPFSGAYTNSTLLQGAKLREGSILAAGGVLRGDTEPWTIYAGVPAKPIKKRNKEKVLEYAKKLGY